MGRSWRKRLREVISTYSGVFSLYSVIALNNTAIVYELSTIKLVTNKPMANELLNWPDIIINNPGRQQCQWDSATRMYASTAEVKILHFRTEVRMP